MSPGKIIQSESKHNNHVSAISHTLKDKVCCLVIGKHQEFHNFRQT